MENKYNMVKEFGEQLEDEEYFPGTESSNTTQEYSDEEIEHVDSLVKENDEDLLDEGIYWDTDEIWWRIDFDKSWSDRDPETWVTPQSDPRMYWPQNSDVFDKKQNSTPSNSNHLTKKDLKVNKNCALRQFAAKRLAADICDVWNDEGTETNGIIAIPMEDDLFLWKISMSGPENSPFEGRLIEGYLQFTAEYPYVPPTVTFSPTIFHPSVSESGDMCLKAILKHWTPCHSLLAFLISVKYLLAEPSTLDPVNPIAAEVFDLNPIMYAEMARESAPQRIPLKPTGSMEKMEMEH